jgi:hypothetical protein
MINGFRPSLSDMIPSGILSGVLVRVKAEKIKAATRNGLELHVTELKTAHDAQNAPSLYTVFNLVYNGKLLVDHYVSTTRFQNIIKKELH